jgi:glycosyltransferase involved in cell wall biosynthesis
VIIPEKEMPALLFVVQLPPPLHGASMMNRHIVESKLLKSNFRMVTVNLHFAETVQELGKFSLTKVWMTFVYAYEIAVKVMKHKPDLVYFNLTPKGFALYRDSFYVFILKMLGQKIVFHLQSKGIRENAEQSGLKKLLYKMVFRNTSLICLSPRLKTDFDSVFKAEPFFIPNGVERQAAESDGAIERHNPVPRIMYLSHYLREKGVLILIDALAILKERGVMFTARLIGPPADFSITDLEEIAAGKDLQDEVEIVGPKYGEDKFHEFINADIFVFPTYYEVFGLVILEAMQFSLPVVATIEGGIPDIVIEGETGFLVEKQNSQMLADKLEILLNDKEMREMMGTAGYRRFLQNYTFDKFESNILDTIQTILKQAK